MDWKTLTPVTPSDKAVAVGAISSYVERFVAVRARGSSSSRKLVIGLDIGTTSSGVAYAFLDPGKVPQIQSVTRHAFPPILYPATMVTSEG